MVGSNCSQDQFHRVQPVGLSATPGTLNATGDVMKRQAFMVWTTLSFLVMLTAASVAAQSGPLLVAHIPFEFVMGTKSFPAGEYNFALAQFGGADAMKIQ